ncbi:unnamed protein product [Porites evermanni]|uniref:Uncharacterized protein n=1 Tax=Porites evermanni TaxID=104178 RepID=A0ABN8R0V9_9CNID|nr:unnamed protein product [Porites evermanni]
MENFDQSTGATSKANMEYPQKGYIYVQRYLSVN